MKRTVVSLVAALLGACSPQVSPQIVTGTVVDLPVQIQRLLAAPPEGGAILIVALADSSEDFIQFAVAESVIELDHPLVTDRQQARETAVRKALEQAGCEPKVNLGTGGARFLDCYLPRSAGVVARVGGSVLRDVFLVEDSTPLVFTSYGL